jgi:hypothetical protein
MASAVAKIKLSPSRDIPFNKLVLSQANVRRVKAGVSTEQLTHRQEADRETFARAWSSEVAEVAPFTDSEIHIVAGLLHRSGSACRESTRVCRLQTDSCKRIIGRKVSPAGVASAVEIDASNLLPDAAFAALQQPANTATCSTSSARPAASPISTTLPTKPDAF